MNEWIDEMNEIPIIHNFYKFVWNRLIISKYFSLVKAVVMSLLPPAKEYTKYKDYTFQLFPVGYNIKNAYTE